MKKTLFDKNTTVAIIGFGRFGQLIVDILLKYSRAKVILISSKKLKLSHKNLTLEPVSGVKKADIIIPCVPISCFESVIKQISSLIKKGAVIMDVCSVKVLPVQLMKTYLPKSVQIVASHPMFGPDSYRIKKRLKGLKLVLFNISAKKETYRELKSFFSNLELKIIELSPEDHDKYMAFSLGYSYLVGKIGQRINIKKTPIDTYDFQLLLEHVSIIKSDTEQLFIDMQTKNPYAKNVLFLFKKNVDNIFREITSVS